MPKANRSSGTSRGRRRVTLHLSWLPQGAPLAHKTVDARRSGWHSFPLAVGDAGGPLPAGGGTPLRLRVSCPLCARAGAAPVLEAAGGGQRPFLMVAVRAGGPGGPGGRPRSRRGAGECEDGGEARGCCRRRFYVDFKAIGWSDWIIAPPGYHANYCQGDCPPLTPPHHLGGGAGGSGASFHAAVLGHYRLRGLGPPGGLRSCCAPTRLRPMSLLYYDQQQHIVKKDIQDMVVEECGCS